MWAISISKAMDITNIEILMMMVVHKTEEKLRMTKMARWHDGITIPHLPVTQANIIMSGKTKEKMVPMTTVTASMIIIKRIVKLVLLNYHLSQKSYIILKKNTLRCAFVDYYEWRNE